MRQHPVSRPVLLMALALLSLALFVFAVVKAGRVSFSYDETWTYLQHVRKGLLFQPPEPGMMGNHHLLNVWGMMLARRLLGDSELALRSPNLLAYAGYLFATVRIVLRARTALLALAGWILLNAHPYLIDFFCVARGYGIGSGAVMLSLWSATRFYTEGLRLKDLAWSIVWAAMAAMANLVLVNFLLAVCVVLAIALARGARAEGLRTWRKHIVVLSIIAAIGIAGVLPNALAMLRSGPIGFGCKEYWTCGMASLGRHLLYGHHPWIAPLALMQVVAATIVVVILLVAVPSLLHGWSASLAQACAGLAILLLYVSGFIVQHAVLGIPFPEDRMTVVLVPQAAFVLVSFLIAFSGPPWKAATFAGLLATPVSVHWAQSLDPGHTDEWRGSACTRTLLSMIAADRRPLVPERPAVVLGTDLEISGSIGYYVHAHHWHWLLVRDHTMPDRFPPSDYYIVSDASASVGDTLHWSLLFTDEVSGHRLYRDDRYVAWRGNLLHKQPLLINRTILDETPQLEWTVPEGTVVRPPGLITGAARIVEFSNAYWSVLVLTVQRGDRLLLHTEAASHRQIQAYGEWSTINVELPLREQLLPGDIVRCSLGPSREPGHGPFRAGSMDLYISQ